MWVNDMKSILLCESEQNVRRVFAPETVRFLEENAELDESVYNKQFVLEHKDLFRETRYIFSTWGMPVFTEEDIHAVFPKLECVFYGAGSVQEFARPFLNCGIKVFSAWGANGIPVAEYTVAQIILANKGFFATSRLMSAGNLEESRNFRDRYPGNFEEFVGIIGAGMIGKLVIEKLKDYRLSIKVFDPFLPDAAAEAMDVQKCSLEELFSTCMVVSNHLANNAQTKGMLQGKHFEAMRPYATFLNTGRGAQVVEADLARVLRERPDLTAILDVTYPEPPVAGHPFYQLPNCVLTPHIAGSSGNEVRRMAEYMAQEYENYTSGVPCHYEVTLEMLETMA